MRYLKIIEKSGYQALPWVRYITQNGDYQLRTNWFFTGNSSSFNSTRFDEVHRPACCWNLRPLSFIPLLKFFFFLLFKALILLYFSLSRNIISPFPPLYFSLYSSCLITITYIGPISGVFFSSPDPGEKRDDNRVYVWVLVLGGGVLCWKEIANSAKGCEERICYMVRGSFYFLFCCLFVFADSCRFSFLPPVA